MRLDRMVEERGMSLEQAEARIRHQSSEEERRAIADIVIDSKMCIRDRSWKHIDHPSEVVKVGDKVTVEVLDVDLDRERISLALDDLAGNVGASEALPRILLSRLQVQICV